MALKITAFVNSYLLGLTKCSSSNVSIYPINNMADPEQVCLIYKAFHATSLVLTSLSLCASGYYQHILMIETYPQLSQNRSNIE